MIEPIMYLAIGFLVSMLFGLMIVPLVARQRHGNRRAPWP